EYGRPREVLGGDQLDLPALALELVADEPRDLGVDRVETSLLQLLERRLGRGHRWMLLGEGAGALPQDARLSAAEVDNRGRHAGQLAHVDDGSASGPNLLGDVGDTTRVGATRQVRARRGDDAHRADDSGGFGRQVRDTDADLPHHEG